MNNLINVFMDYKINRLTEYGVLIYGEDTPFIRQIFNAYIRTYIDNYYYGVFNTIEDGSRYNERNLELEFTGIMQEMLNDYRIYELQVSNQEYKEGRDKIQRLKNFTLELVKIDFLEFEDKDDIPGKVEEYVSKYHHISSMINNNINKLCSLVRETYNTCNKMLNYEGQYFDIIESRFEKNKDIHFLTLNQNIKMLNNYRKAMVSKIYGDVRLDSKKLECLIQKISLQLLKDVLNKKDIDKYIVEINSSVINRGKIDADIMALIDNPIIRKYVVIGVNYNTYLEQKSAFSEDYNFACLQDFSHINDVYQKVDNIYNEGVFNYLVVLDCKYRDRDFFLNYTNDSMKVLVFEEE